MTEKWAFVRRVSGIPKICPLCGSNLSKSELEHEKCSKCSCQWIIRESKSEKRGENGCGLLRN